MQHEEDVTYIRDIHDGSSSIVGYTFSWYFCSSSTVRSHRLFACVAVSSGVGTLWEVVGVAAAAAAAARDDSASDDEALNGHMMDMLS